MSIETPDTDSRTATSVLDRVTSLLTDPFGPATEVDITAAELLRVVANDRRRHVLRILEDGDPVPKDVLAHHVAAREGACAVAEVTSTERKRAYVSLHQTHLPRLVDAGLVTCEDGTVIPQPGVEAALEVYRTASAVAGGESA